MFTIGSLLSGIELGVLIGPLWRKFLERNANQDILIYGVVQPRSIPILDNQIAIRTSELSQFQKLSLQKLLKLIRQVINTKAFELALAKMIVDKDKFTNKNLDTNFKVL